VTARDARRTAQLQFIKRGHLVDVIDVELYSTKSPVPLAGEPGTTPVIAMADCPHCREALVIGLKDEAGRPVLATGMRPDGPCGQPIAAS
jgi:hypothetical protein